MDQGQLVLNGARFEQDFLHLSPNISLRYHAAVKSKGANSGIKVRSPLVAHNLSACLVSNTPDSATLQMPSAWLKALPSWDEMSRVHAVVNSSSLCFLSRCCRCYWCRVASWAPSLFSISQQKQHQSESQKVWNKWLANGLPLKSALSVETLKKLLDFEPKMLAQHCGFAWHLLLMMCCFAYSIP